MMYEHAVNEAAMRSLLHEGTTYYVVLEYHSWEWCTELDLETFFSGLNPVVAFRNGEEIDI